MSIKDIINDEKKLREVARVAFDSVDTDKSGEIDKDELAKVMEGISKDLGVAPPTSAEINEVLVHLDSDKSGKIDFDEFVVLIKDVLTAMSESS